MQNRLSKRILVVVLPLVALPSHLPQVVVASPLIAPPPPFDAPLPHLVPAPQPPICLLLRIPHPPPAGFSFGCRAPAEEWMKMGALLGFWSIGVLGATRPLLPPEIESRINYMFVIHNKKLVLGPEICLSQTHITYVFVIHKHKINFGIALILFPLFPG
jgi:hypothetical protein